MLRTLDIGPGDVHTDSAGALKRRPMATKASETDKDEDAEEQEKPKKKGRRLHIRADIAHGGSLSVRHMADGSEIVHLPAIDISRSAE